MDLSSLYKQTVEELENQKADLARKEEAVSVREQAAKEAEDQLAKDQAQLQRDQASVSDILDVKAQIGANAARNQELDILDATLKKKDIDLKKYENSLYEIASNQAQKDQELKDRESAVAERERTYQDSLKQKFADSVVKNLLK